MLFYDNNSDYLRLGSDEEFAMRKAMHFAFPKAERLVCTRHMKENVTRYLTDKVGVDIKKRDEIVKMLFGKDGMIGCKDKAIFDDRSDQFIKKIETETTSDFVAYVHTKILVLLRDNLSAGFAGWTSNNVESINHVLKQMINWKPQMLPELIRKLGKKVRCQLADATRAIYGLGEYRLRPTHSHLLMSIEAWSALTEKEQQNKIQKCFVVNPKSKTVTSTNKKFVMQRPPTTIGQKKHQRKRKRTARTVTPMKKSKLSNCQAMPIHEEVSANNKK
jgi:hypothetical protein